MCDEIKVDEHGSTMTATAMRGGEEIGKYLNVTGHYKRPDLPEQRAGITVGRHRENGPRW